MDDVKDLSKGSIYKNIIYFAFPVFLSQLFQQLYNTADALIVGKLLGSDAFAAVSSSGTLIFLFTSFFIGTAAGAGVVIGKYFGAKDYDNVSKAIHTNIAFSLLCGLFLTVAGIVFTPALLKLMKTDPEIMGDAVEYFRYYFLGAVSVVMYNSCRGILNALGDSKRPLYYLIVSSVMNIVLDIVMIYFTRRVWAAAVATIISQTFSVVLCMIHLCKKGQVYTLSLRKMRIDGLVLKEILRIGVPSGVQNSVIALANVVVQSQINSFKKFATAAFGAHSKLEGFAFLPITSFNMAITAFVSQNLGAKEYDRARKGSRFGIVCSVVMAEIIGIIYFVFAKQFVSIFDSTPEVVRLGMMEARTSAIFYFLLAFSHSIAAVCTGAGRSFVPMTVMLSVWCAFRVTYILTVMYFFRSIRLVYWAYPITWAISSVIYAIYYLKSDWVHGFERRK